MRVLCLKSLVQFQEGFTLVNLSFDKLYVNTWQALWDGNKYIASWTYSIGEKLRPRYIQCFIYIVWICKALPQVTYSLIEQQQQQKYYYSTIMAFMNLRFMVSIFFTILTINNDSLVMYWFIKLNDVRYLVFVQSQHKPHNLYFFLSFLHLLLKW